MSAPEEAAFMVAAVFGRMELEGRLKLLLRRANLNMSSYVEVDKSCLAKN